MYTEQGKYQEAIQEYNQALLMRLDEHTHYFLFEAWLLLEKWEEAKSAVEAAMKDPESNITWQVIADLMKEYRGGISHFEQRYEVSLPEDIAQLIREDQALENPEN